MRLYIRNMVCNRCILAVEDLFRKLGHTDFNVDLGVVELLESSLPDESIKALSSELKELGFELINDRNTKIIDFIKTLIIKKIHHEDMEKLNESWSELISKTLFHDYRYLSTLFSSVEGKTIEHYIIQQKIEKVKELIAYEDLTLSEIAYRLKYSSVSHLSSQFRKVTGMTPSSFRKMDHRGRRTLDKV